MCFYNSLQEMQVTCPYKIKMQPYPPFPSWTWQNEKSINYSSSVIPLSVTLNEKNPPPFTLLTLSLNPLPQPPSPHLSPPPQTPPLSPPPPPLPLPPTARP